MPSRNAGGLITFDVFSALTNSRVGGTAYFAALATERGWSVDPADIYDGWDARNKELHRTHAGWASFRELSAVALQAAFAALEVSRPDEAIAAGLVESMTDWPLWPDVTLAAFGPLDPHRLGLLTNIDNDLLASTAVARLGLFEADAILTSERLHSYKPAAGFYAAAEATVGPFIHVASSARDVRGAGSAGLRCIRLARSGHPLDPNGPVPRWTIESLADLPAAVATAEETD
jgi:2-haloalkanoic acid dehalogenase type II